MATTVTHTHTAELETWEMRTPGKVVLNVLKANRFGQPIEGLQVIGPKRVGHRFTISADDRRDNQERCADPRHDPFRNGTLRRVDADQQADPETASDAALSDEDILAIIDLPDEAFQARIAELDELPVRSVRDMAEAAGASHTKVTWLDEHIRERFQTGAPQRSLTDDAKAERLS